ATTESFYELLGIPVSGSHDDIKRAYKQLARKYHPDVSPPDRTEEYTQRFILVQEAYETLSDPECRALYDRYLARGLHYALSARRRFGEVGLLSHEVLFSSHVHVPIVGIWI
ncbi:chaperone protein dnaJ 20, chloroplastic-like, partial [Dendrobium catenatum]|uniref:chaperone protein dnaJ 20, chloroplastic-like n=1 Tax=Dendrobium catenatum TaxID=906689 RepID=UPI00109F5632